MAAPELHLVTGAAGFIGRCLVRRLSAAGLRVRAFARPGAAPPEFSLPGVEVLRGDLRDPAALEAAAEGVSVAWHLGALVRPRGFLVSRAALLRELRETNAEATAALAAACARSGARRFVYFSSVSALGPGPGLSDAAEPRPLTLYGKSKLEGERLLRGVPGLDRLVLRPAMIYGPGAPVWSALFDSVRRGKASLPGRGENLFSVCYVENLLDAALLAAEKAPPGSAFNVSEGSAPVRELALLIGELVGRRPLLLPAPVAGVKLFAALFEPLLAAFGLAMPGFIGADRARVEEACSSVSHRCEGLRALGWRPRFSTREGFAASLGVKP